MEKHFESICVGDTLVPLGNINPHIPPIYATSTFKYESAEKAQEVFKGNEHAYIYGRWDNPNFTQVEEKVAALEAYGIRGLKLKALLFSSGMAAISSLIFSLKLKAGDAILTQGNLYGTTTELLYNVVSHQGIEIIYHDLKDLDSTGRIIREKYNIRLLYIETPANPTMDCYDLQALSDLAWQHNVKVAVDNTFSTPFLQQPFRYGVDYVVHSATKFLNGHGTALGGLVIGKNIEHMEKEVWRMRKLLGGTSSAFDAFLLNNGLKTLPLRMERHCSNAKEVAQFLVGHPKVAKVNYNGLSSHPDYELAKKQMRDFTSMLSFELKGGMKAGIHMMNHVQMCVLTASLGTADTLIQHPASMTHFNVPEEQRKQFGITDGLVRLSVGLESAQDIIADLDQAMG